MEAFPNLLTPVNVFESDRSVEEAATPSVVSTYTKPFAFVLSVPTVVVARVIKPAKRLVDEALMNDEYAVDDE